MIQLNIDNSCISLLHISLFMLSIADPRSYYQIALSQGIGMGVGSGFLLVPAISVQAHHWRKHRSLAMGIVLAGDQESHLNFCLNVDYVCA